MKSFAAEPRVLVTETPSTSARASDHIRAWRWVGWFSLVLAVAGLGDWVLAWIPMRFGSPEWEFGTVASTVSGLPLITMGFAGMLASAVARAVRWQIITVAVIVMLFALCIIAAFTIFLLDVPIAVRAVQGIARIGMFKAIAKTSLLAILFSVTYLVASVSALRFARKLRAQ